MTIVEKDSYTAGKSNPHRDIVFILRFFVQSIITAEERVGKVFARFRMIGSPYSDWSIGGNVVKVDENAFCGESQDEFRRDCNGYIIREMRESDYIDIQVDFQQYTNPWAAVNVFISDDPDHVLMGDEAYLYRYCLVWLWEKDHCAGGTVSGAIPTRYQKGRDTTRILFR